MPLVNIHLAEGRSGDEKRALMAAITDAVHREIGAPRDSVRVWINEFPSDDYMTGGELLSEKQRRLAHETGEDVT